MNEYLKIIKLFGMNYTIDEIAKKMNKTVKEIQTIIDKGAEQVKDDPASIEKIRKGLNIALD